MPVVTLIVLIVVALLLLAMLIAGARKSAAVRHANLGPAADDPYAFRSHAEASRRREDEKP
jgi:hypothetical protein